MTTIHLNITPISAWLPNYNHPLIIAGPCGAETEEQVVSTASALKKLGSISVFRTGVWKPRTRPNSFEGAGSVALKWLQRVKAETGLLTAVEVANAQHVEDALNNNIDILWIGARTTVNPFYVQEIADALKGVDVPVMIKNPVNPDLQLWIGALERINQAGITKLAAIHRGFHSFEKTKYRNAPQWEIPIQLKMSCPGLPVICDPSHISGNRELIASVAQKALDLDMAGLMIESHIDPDHALSDAQQQLTPKALEELLSGLVCRKVKSNDEVFIDQLQQLRNAIDSIDEELLQVLSKRMSVIEQIGEYKKENHITILQIERWMEILRTRKATAALQGLNNEFVVNLLELLHKESIRRQTEVMNSNIQQSIDKK